MQFFIAFKTNRFVHDMRGDGNAFFDLLSFRYAWLWRLRFTGNSLVSCFLVITFPMANKSAIEIQERCHGRTKVTKFIRPDYSLSNIETDGAHQLQRIASLDDSMA